MSREELATDPVERAPRADPLAAVAFGVLLAAAMAFAYLAWTALFGDMAAVFPHDATWILGDGHRGRAVIAVLTAFLIAAGRYERAASAYDLAELEQLTGVATASLRDDLARDPGVLWRRRGVLAVTLVVGLAVIPASSSDARYMLRPADWSADFLWAVPANLLLFFVIGREANAAADARRLWRGLGALVPLDLLDRQPLAPFAREGLRRATIWLVGSSIASVISIDTARAWPVLLIVAATLLIASSSFLAPSRAIHRRLVALRRDELAVVHARILGEKARALGAQASGANALSGLLAYESRVAAVNPWPFDTSVLMRLLALGVLATGSWLGGAIVERAVGAVLD